MKHRWQIALVQINSNGMTYLPYVAGLLEAYTRKHARDPEQFEFLIPVYRPVSEAQTRWYFRAVDLVGFSTYVWNEQRSLAMARTIRAVNPQALIVFGGPQVPDRAEAFLRTHPFIDLCVHGEGEAVFLQVLERLASRDWRGIPGVSYLLEGAFIHQPRGPRLKALDQIPSPYLSGVFEPLMRSQKNPVRWSGLWETNRGCPFSCAFCDWGSAVQSKIYRFEMSRLEAEIDWFVSHQLDFVFCCDANFGILPRDLELARYLARMKKEWGYPRVMSFQNAKNATERVYEIQTLLYGSGLNLEVTLSMQSLDVHTLESIQRENISSDSWRELQSRFARDGIMTYTDMIVGLPGESYASFCQGVHTLLKQGQHSCVKFHNAVILPNAAMADPDYRQRFGLQTVQVPLANAHSTSPEATDQVVERQELVIGSKDMPPEDWVKTRVFAWVINLFHFRKEWLQLPMMLLVEIAGFRYDQLIEALIAVDETYPLLHAGMRLLSHKARAIQQGDYEFIMGEGEWQRFWIPDEYLFLQWLLRDEVEAVYAECLQCFQALLAEHHASLPPGLLTEAFALNQLHFHLDLKPGPFTMDLHWNLWEYWHGLRQGVPVPLQPASCTYVKDWEGKPFTLRRSDSTVLLPPVSAVAPADRV